MDNKINDLTYLSWSISKNSSGTAGSFLKSYEIIDGVKYYYKMSNFDTVNGIVGHESINEIVAQNVASILNIEHLEYELLYALVLVNGKEYKTWITKSRDFKEKGEHKLTFETYFEMNSDGEDIWKFICEKELKEYFYDLFIFDYIICNRDRHGANIEILEKDDNYRLAPVFDNGLSFLFSCYNDCEEMKQFDKLKDGPVNNYVGSMSLMDNLKKVPKDILSKVKKEMFTKNSVFKTLDFSMDAVPNIYWNIVYEMILERVEVIEKICN